MWRRGPIQGSICFKLVPGPLSKVALSWTYSADVPCSNLAAKSCGGHLAGLDWALIPSKFICNEWSASFTGSTSSASASFTCDVCDSMVENNIGMVWITLVGNNTTPEQSSNVKQLWENTIAMCFNGGEYYLLVKPIDGSFTEIWDSLGSHLRVPYSPKAPVLGLYLTNEGDGCGQHHKMGHLLLRFSNGTYPPLPPSLLLPTLGPFQLDETVTHIGWMWGHEGDGCRHLTMEHYVTYVFKWML